MPKKVMGLLAGWKGSFGRHQSADLWGAVPLCLTWTIWRECNQHVFEGVGCSSDLKLLFLCTMYDWMAAFCGHLFSNLEEFLDICNFQWFCSHPSMLVYRGCIWFSFCNKVLLILKKRFSWASWSSNHSNFSQGVTVNMAFGNRIILFVYFTQPCSEHRVNYSIYLYI